MIEILLFVIYCFTSSFSNLVGSITGNVLQDIILQTDNTPISIIENFGVPSNKSGEVLILLQNDRFNDAVRLVESETNRPTEEVERLLKTVPTSLSEQIESRHAGKSSTGVYDVSSKNNKWQGSSTPADYFDIIETKEQLQIEMIKCSREITEIIFFGHETT